MRPKHTNAIRDVRLAALLAAGLAVSFGVFAGGQGEKIEFSDPATPMAAASNLTATVTPGLNRLNPTPNAFRQVQEDLFRPLANSMRTPDPLDGQLPPPQPPRPAPSKHERELREQRKNWAFTDLNELYPDETVDGALKKQQDDVESAGGEKTSVSLIEKYFDKLGQKGTNRLTPLEAAEMNAATLYTRSATNEADMRAFGSENPATRYLFNPKGKSNDDDNKDVAPGFRTPDPFDNQVVPGEAEAERKRTAEFRKLLDHNTAPAPVGIASGLLPEVNPDPYGLHSALLDKVTVTTTTVVPATPHRSAIDPVLGMIDPTLTALHTRISDDPTAYSLGLPNPKPAPPPPAKDPIKASQQMLDPFGAGVTRPKF
jgi:hypothetical protein